MAFRPLFKASILINADLEDADRQHAEDSFWLFYGLSLIRLHIYITDWFFKGVLVFVITKTKRGLCFRNYEN